MASNATLPQGWRIARFDEFLRRVERKIILDDSKSYDCVGVRWYGFGAFVREKEIGMNIARKQQWVIKAGDVLYNKLFAWKGSFAIADGLVDSCIVSDKFPTYEADTALIDLRFLGYYFQTPQIAQQAQDLSKGAAAISKLTLNPPQFWDLTIPLPPLPEQHRIVARIEELARRVEEARGLRRAAIDEADAIVPSALHSLFEVESKCWEQLPMPEAIAINDRQVDPTLVEFSQLPHISGENIESKTCQLLPFRTAEEDEVKSNNYLFSPNSILYSKIRPYLQKAVFVDFQGVCSADIYPIKVINEKLEPRFVLWSLVAPPFTEYANRLSGRTRMPKLNRKQLFAFTFSYPKREEQRHIVAYLDGLQRKVNELRRLQAETQKELDALMPSILAKAFVGQL